MAMNRQEIPSGRERSRLEPLAAVPNGVSGILGLAIVTGPVFLGATGPWSRFGIEAVMAVATAMWAVSSCPRLSTVCVPLAAAAVICLQLAPLPDSLLSTLAPVSAAAWKVAHAGISHAWGCITVDPATTAAGIRRLFLAVATVVVVATIGRTALSRRRLSFALAAACIVMWSLGLVFPFDKSLVLLGFIDCRGPIAAEFWKTPLVHPISTNGSGNLDWVTVAGQRYSTPTWIAADGFGPYIYSNHFAGAMCLTLPILLATWLQFSKDRFPDPVRYGAAALVGAGALWTVGILATSRAGAAALLLAMLVFTALTVQRPGLRRAALAITAIYALMLLLFTCGMYGLFPGVEKIFPAEMRPKVAALLADGRAVASRVAVRMFAASPFMGSGLCTFGELFPRFLRGDALLHYAHNDCAQWLAETGLVGGGLLAAFLGKLAICFRSWVRSAPNSDRILQAGAWAALSGIGFHSLFDWNLHIPANALLACVVTGLTIASGTPAVAASRPAIKGGASPGFWITAHGPALILTVACFVTLTFLARDAASETVQRHLRQAIVASRLVAMDSTRPSAASALTAAIASGDRMARWDARNADLATLIGQAHLHSTIEEQPIDAADAHRAAAERWFAVSRRHCAAGRGLPEPVSAVAPTRAR